MVKKTQKELAKALTGKKVGKVVGKAKAKAVMSCLLENEGNQAETARELGISKQAMNNYLQRPEVEREFFFALEKAGMNDDVVAKQMMDGLKAGKGLNELGNEIPDHNTRHKYVQTYLEAKRIIKHADKEGNTVTAIQIINNYE